MNDIYNTNNISDINQILNQLVTPKISSDKGDNGRLLIIGGSNLFHSPVIWSAEIASRIVDLVHVSSNNNNLLLIKEKFIDGIVIQKSEIEYYTKEDECILIGIGMVRGETKIKDNLDFNQIIKLENDVDYTYSITRFLLEKYQSKKFVIDAGSLQMLNISTFSSHLKEIILTPNTKEFSHLFDIDISDRNIDELKDIVKNIANKYGVYIMLKTTIDIISDGKDVFLVKGGNVGLTKGGSGDLLSSLIASFYTKNTAINSMILSSFVLKLSADILFKQDLHYYNTSDLLSQIPKTLKIINS